jgi:molybdopterin molybdotransferase
MTTVANAIQLITAQAKSFGTQKVSIHEAFNRILAQEVVADRDYPPFNRATMDGYAIQSADFLEKKLTRLQVLENLFAGGVATQQVISGTCVKIMTGAPAPQGADTIIRVEDTRQEGETVYFTNIVIKKGQNIASQGEDAKQGDILIAKNQIIDATVMSGLAVTGQAEVLVEKLPEIAIISTGNEIVPVGQPVLPHQIRDSNTFAIKSFFSRYQILSPATILAPDSKTALTEAIRSVLDKDILVLSGGVSKGDADYVPEVLLSLGVKQIFHRIQIKPGAPLWFGILPNGGAVFGLPGNPVSVQVACRLFIESYLRTCFGTQSREPMVLPFLSNKTKKTKFDEYFPCKIVTTSHTSGLVPLRNNSSGDIAATLGSDGIALHPYNIETLAENTPVQFYFW